MYSVFVSHVFEDRKYVDQLRDWAKRGELGKDVVITGETRDVRQQGDTAIKSLLSPLLTGASCVLVLVGNNSHNHGWVDYEVNHALSGRKLVIPVRLPNTFGAGPSPLQKVKEVAFSPGAIGGLIQR
jgi:hypothetical protein